MKEYKYTVVFRPAEEGGYTVYVPALPGCVTEGDTLEEAKRMIAEAMELYLESLRDDGVPFPVEDAPSATTPFLEHISVAV